MEAQGLDLLELSIFLESRIPKLTSYTYKYYNTVQCEL